MAGVIESVCGYATDYYRNLRLSKMESEFKSLEEEEAQEIQDIIATDILEVYDTHLLIDKNTYVRCIIGGLSEEDVDGLPPGLTEESIERIKELTNGGARVEICTSLKKIPRMIVSSEMKEAYAGNAIDKKNAEEHNEGSYEELKLKYEKIDIEATYRDNRYYSQNAFYASFIITLMGTEKEVFETEAQVVGVLESELIEYSIPYELMLPAFLVSRPFPNRDSRFEVKIHSDTAAILCTSTSLNSTIDDEGFIFGKDRNTLADIIINENVKPSKHRVYFGPTGAGKTFTVTMHIRRAMSIYGCRACVITPKHEKDNFMALANHLGNKAEVICIGEFGDPINLLQIVYDEKSMGNSAAAYSRAYFRHIRVIKQFFATWLDGEDFSAAAKGYLEETLHKVYKQAGIKRKEPKTWKNPMPLLKDLRAIWVADSTDKKLSAKVRAVAEALARKTAAIDEDGSFNFLNRNPDKPINYAADFILFDISGVDDELKDAMNVFVTGIVGNRFQSDLEKETIVIVDEARVFLRNKFLNNFMADGVALGRSYKVFFWIITQNPGDFEKNGVEEMFKSNIPISIVMGATLKDHNVAPVQRYFHLTNSEVEELCTSQQGEGILNVDGETYMIRFEPTLEEYAVIKGLNVADVTLPVIASSEYEIKPEYRKCVEQHKVILKDWVTGNADKLKDDGWIKRPYLPRIEGRGSCVLFYKQGTLQGDQVCIPDVLNMKVEHLVCVIQIEGFLIAHGIRVEVDHKEGADVKFWINGKLYAIEYETGVNNIQTLLNKKKALLAETEDFRFVCSADPKAYQKLCDVVGEDYVAPRGDSLMAWLNAVIRGDNTRPSPGGHFEETQGIEIDVAKYEVEGMSNDELKEIMPEFMLKMVSEGMSSDQKRNFIAKLKVKTKENREEITSIDTSVDEHLVAGAE